MKDVQEWLSGRLPDGWFDGPPEVVVDREEIVIVGHLAAPPSVEESGQSGAAELGRVGRFREETRPARMQIAEEAESHFARKVSWGASCGKTVVMFTNLSIPVMTRLRQAERKVLDILVEGGVARSRSDALAWCVRLVGRHEGDWIEELRASLEAVRQARANGPAA